MRVSTALTIGVSLALRVFAQSPAAVGNIPRDTSVSRWTAAYESGIAAGRQGNDEEALAIFQRCWDSAYSDEERGLAADNLGETNRRLGHLNDARQWLERSRQAFSRDPRLSLRLAVAISNLADLDRATGNYSAAERKLRDSLDSPLCDNESRGLIRNYLGDLLREEGRSAEAAQLFHETLGSREIPQRLRAGAFIGLADIDRQHSAWNSSIDKWNAAIEIARSARDDATEAVALRGLGETWLESGSPARAEPLLRRSLRMMESAAGMPPEEVAGVHASLASLYRSMNKLLLAENEWTRAIDIDRRVLGPGHPQIAILMEMLSDVHSARGQFGLALDYAERASEAMRGSFGETSMPAAAALSNQAVIEQRAGDFGSADRHFRLAIGIARSHPEHRSLQSLMMERYACLLRAMHRSREAKSLLAESNAWKNTETAALPVK